MVVVLGQLNPSFGDFGPFCIVCASSPIRNGCPDVNPRILIDQRLTALEIRFLGNIATVCTQSPIFTLFVDKICT